jgi:hypothetical protein
VIARTAALVSLLGLGACISPSVLDSEGRAIDASGDDLAWSAARAEDFDGLFESVRIEGDVASALGKVYYHFSPDGTFSGAALVFDGARPAFQTLSGTWTLSEVGLDLGDGEPARAFVAVDHVKLETSEGTAVLRRVPLE